MKTTESDWYTPTEGERLIYDPEPLAVATLEGFEGDARDGTGEP